jgi:hypothetical protein
VLICCSGLPAGINSRAGGIDSLFEATPHDSLLGSQP